MRKRDIWYGAVECYSCSMINEVQVKSSYRLLVIFSIVFYIIMLRSRGTLKADSCVAKSVV